MYQKYMHVYIIERKFYHPQLEGFLLLEAMKAILSELWLHSYNWLHNVVELQG